MLNFKNYCLTLADVSDVQDSNKKMYKNGLLKKTSEFRKSNFCPALHAATNMWNIPPIEPQK